MTNITWADVSTARFYGDRLVAANASPQTPSPFALDAQDVRYLAQKEIDELSKRPRLVKLSYILRVTFSPEEYTNVRKSRLLAHVYRQDGRYLTVPTFGQRCRRFTRSLAKDDPDRIWWGRLSESLQAFAGKDVLCFDL